MMAALYDPPQHSDPLTRLHRTNSINFVSAFIALGMGIYIRTELSPSRPEATFVVQDTDSIAVEYERRFAAGLFPPVPPKAMMEVRNFLLEEVRAVKNLASGGRHVKA